MIINFSFRILSREKTKLFLPFVSILIAAIVAILSYNFILASKTYIESKNKELLGGDVYMRSARDFDIYKYINSNNIKVISEQVNFNGLIKYKDNGIVADFVFVDNLFPLYGNLELLNNQYQNLKSHEVYIDKNLQSRYKVNIGDKIFFNEKPFVVKDIITLYPETLVSGVSFYPRILFSKDAIVYSNIDINTFKKDFKKKVILNNILEPQDMTSIKSLSRQDGISVSFAGEDGYAINGLKVIENFVLIIVIVVAIICLINIYTSINFLTDRLRRIFSILMALGLFKQGVYKILFIVSSFIIFGAGLLGVIVSHYLTTNILSYIHNNFNLNIYYSFSVYQNLFIILIIYIISIFAILPIFKKLKNISPKDLLYNSGNNSDNLSSYAKDILFIIIPLFVICVYVLDSIIYGFVFMISVISFYTMIMICYNILISYLYNIRDKFGFSIKLMLAQKKFDGILGIVAFSSLFFALLCVYSISILRTNIANYLNNNLKDNLPSVYLLDLQKSQVQDFKNKYSNVNLFPNISARIVSIDGVNIQSESSDFDREVKREFNLTYSDILPDGDKVLRGNFDKLKSGELSIEEDFAQTIKADIDSIIVFNVQGFEISAKVTSVRSSDKSSGKPFFFFVFAPEQLKDFPATFFGYMYIEKSQINNLYFDMANNFPNVSIINTTELTESFSSILQTLIIIILLISLPPIILSVLLIVNITASLSKDRKRDGARLMAIGKTKLFVRNYFILEVSTTVVMASFIAYILSIVITNVVSIYFLNIDSVILFDIYSIYIFLSLFFAIIILGILLWYKDKTNIKDYLNQQDNN